MALDGVKRTLRSLFQTLPEGGLQLTAETQIQMLSEISRAVGSSLEGPDAAHRLITEAVTTLLGVERSILFLPDNGCVQAVAASGLVGPKEIAALRIPQGDGLVGRVFAEGRTVFVGDGEGTDGAFSPALAELGVGALVAAPLRLQNEVIGVITADTKRDGTSFGRDEIRLLEVFGTLAALVASEARLIDQLRQRTAEMERLFQVAREVNGEGSPNEVLKQALHAAVELTDSTSGSLIFVDPGRHELIIRAAEGLPEDVGERLKLGIGQGVTGWVAREGISARIDDVRDDPRYVEAAGDVRSELAVPIRTGAEIVGVLNVDSTRGNAYSEKHQNLLEALADLAAAKIRLAFLEGQAEAPTDA